MNLKPKTRWYKICSIAVLFQIFAEAASLGISAS